MNDREMKLRALLRRLGVAVSPRRRPFGLPGEPRRPSLPLPLPPGRRHWIFARLVAWARHRRCFKRQPCATDPTTLSLKVGAWNAVGTFTPLGVKGCNQVSVLLAALPGWGLGA